MRRHSFAVPALAFALLTVSCGSTTSSADGPAITVARIETTLMSEAPEELASSGGGDTTVDVDAVEEDECDAECQFEQVEEAIGAESDTVGNDDSGQEDAVEDDGAGSTAPSVPESGTKPATANFDTQWVSFEIDDIFDDVHVVGAYVPVGWDVSDDSFGTTFDSSDYGFFTELSFDNGCDGSCEPKDWATALNGADGILTSKRDSGQEILMDQDLGNGWLMVRQDDSGAIDIDRLRWDNDESFFFQCQVTLDEEDAGLLDDMIAICEAARPQWLG